MSYKPYNGQKYEDLKAKCLKAGRLFEDETFPANDTSLFRKNPMRMKIVWKRPVEILQNPQFIVNSIVADDLDQGQLGEF